MTPRAMTEVEMQRELERLATELQGAFGGSLRSVILYGSAARGDHAGSGASDLNVLVVLKDLSLESLEKGAKASRSWEAAGNRPLLFFSPEWIERSRDVFPIEFSDMLDARRVVWGEDSLAGLQVSPEHLRLQAENEIKTKLIHLRTGYVRSHDDEEALGRLIAASYAPVVALCRAALRISGEPIPRAGGDAVRKAAALYGMDPVPFDEAAAVKRGGPAAASMAVKLLFKRYYAQVDALARAIDAGIPRGGNP